MRSGDVVGLLAGRLEELLEQGLSLREIARVSRCSERTVRNVGARFGIVMPNERARRRFADVTIKLERLAATGALDGRSILSIADELGLSRDRAAVLLEMVASERVRARERPQLSDGAWLRARVEAGASIGDLAVELDVSRARVREAFDVAGLDRRRRSGPAPTFPLLYDDDWLAAQLSRRTRQQIADELGCSPAAVSAAANRIGRNAATIRYPQLSDAAWLRRRYVLQRRTRASIAAEVGCSVAAVDHALTRHRLMPRPRHDRDTVAAVETAGAWRASTAGSTRT